MFSKTQPSWTDIFEIKILSSDLEPDPLVIILISSESMVNLRTAQELLFSHSLIISKTINFHIFCKKCTEPTIKMWLAGWINNPCKEMIYLKKINSRFETLYLISSILNCRKIIFSFYTFAEGLNKMQKKKSYSSYSRRYWDCIMSHDFSWNHFCISFHWKKKTRWWYDFGGLFKTSMFPHVWRIWFASWGTFVTPQRFIYGMLWHILSLSKKTAAPAIWILRLATLWFRLYID